MISRTRSPSSSGVALNPLSQSTVKGTDRQRAMRRVAPRNSAHGMRSPSGYPSDQETPALVVATARHPTSWNTRALSASQALGRTNISPWCMARKSFAAWRCSDAFMVHELAWNVRGNTERDAQSVPAVDGDDSVHERRHLGLRELGSCRIVHRVRHLASGDPGDRFSQRQG